MHIFRAVFCVAAVCLAMPPIAPAARITLRVDASTSVSNHILTITCRLRNLGDADAERVRVRPYDSIPEDGITLGSLPAGADAETHLRIPLAPEAPPGQYHQLLTITYRDRGGHETGIPLAAPYQLGAPPDESAPANPLLVADLTPLALRRKGDLVLTAAALRDAPLHVTVTPLVPLELTLSMAPFEWRVPAHGASRRLPLANRAARPGSRYRVMVVLDSMDGARHASDVVGAWVVIRPSRLAILPWRRLLSILAITLALIPCLSRWRGSTRGRPRSRFDVRVRGRRRLALRGLNCALPWLAALFVAWQVMPPEIFSDTTAVGGDTVAHHYIVSRLRATLLSHGRIVSWAPGWWSGFPLFQYYFPLPYLVILLLDLMLPYNVAFKIGSILGVVLTPLTIGWAARRVRLPTPAPAMLSLASIPLLLDTTHTMWGVNAYSTLAGMIANSYSFALLPPALACVLHDARRGRASAITVLFTIAVVASHFFTALIMGLLYALTPFLPGIPKRRQACRAILVSGGLALLLSAWWWIPLVAKRPWSVDFGVNWDVHPFRQFPLAVRRLWLPALAAACVLAWEGIRRKENEPVRRPPVRMLSFSASLLAMLAISAVAFRYGYAVSPVFVNVRLWPFIVYAVLALIALCAAAWARRMPHGPCWMSMAFMTIMLALAWDPANHARAWARHNFRGLEKTPDGAALFERLVAPLDGTPGRLSVDLHPDNERLGSSRVFECVPHLVDKPILEGGLVNSAMGSLAAYLIQSEISDNAAGFPPRVRPRTFDPDAATLHLTWMNVAHFIARSPRTRKALAEHPFWDPVATYDAWTLFVNRAHHGQTVRVLRNHPVPVREADLQADQLEWLYRPAAILTPFIYLPPGMPPPSDAPPAIDRNAYLARLAEFEGRPLPSPDDLFDTHPIRSEHVGDRTIRFETEAVGRPHLVAVNWFPNWRSRGADGPYPVSPGFMLVYPRTHQVTLWYDDLPVDRAARGISAAGWLLFAFWGWKRKDSRHANAT